MAIFGKDTAVLDACLATYTASSALWLECESCPRFSHGKEISESQTALKLVATCVHPERLHRNTQLYGKELGVKICACYGRNSDMNKDNKI